MKIMLFVLIMLKLVTSFCTKEPPHMIYFIRHAESKYNIIDNQLQTKFGTNYANEL